jgi:hypothetical protein
MENEGSEEQYEAYEEERNVVTDTVALFGLVGDHGNSLMIYETDSIVLRHQISVGVVIRSFTFTANLKKILVVTKD